MERCLGSLMPQVLLVDCLRCDYSRDSVIRMLKDRCIDGQAAATDLLCLLFFVLLCFELAWALTIRKTKHQAHRTKDKAEA
jgi:hypothetical protein